MFDVVIKSIAVTGLTTENVKFVSLAGIQFSMVCPVCGGIHRWKQRDAWVESSGPNQKTPPSATPNDAGAASGLASASQRQQQAPWIVATQIDWRPATLLIPVCPARS